MHSKKFGVKDLLHAKPAHLKELMHHKSLPVVAKDLAHMQVVAAPVLSGMKRDAEEELSAMRTMEYSTEDALRDAMAGKGPRLM